MNGGVIEWNLMGSVVIIIVFLLRQGLKGIIKKSWIYGLWIIVLIRLLIPQFPTSSLSIYNLPSFIQNQKITEISQEKLAMTAENAKRYKTNPLKNTQETQIQGSQFQALSETVDLIGSQNQFTQKTDSFMKKNIIYMHLWLIGVMGLSIYYAYGYYKVKKKLKQLELVAEESLLQCFTNCKQKLNVKNDITLVYDHTPMLFGIFKPIICIPRNYELKEQELMLLHELMHYKYKDNIVTYFQLVVLVIHWFNPLVWFAMNLMKEDMELSCDERVLLLGVSKKEYAQTLIKAISIAKLEENFSQGMGDSPKQTKNRVMQIARFKQPKLWCSIFAFLVVALLMVGCLSNPNDFEVGRLSNPNESAIGYVSNPNKSDQNSTIEQADDDLSKNQYKDLTVKNIALLGVDQSKLRVDSILIMRVNDTTKATTLISIPRDTQVTLDNEQKALFSNEGITPPDHIKISQLLLQGGKKNIHELLLGEIEELLDLKISNYILVDIESAEAFIDDLGGIEVEVPQDMQYVDISQNLNISLNKGYQRLNGKQTLDFIRFRGYPEGDLHRNSVGQQVAKAILEKLINASSPQDISTMALNLISTLDTDASIKYLDIYLNMLQNINMSQIQSFVIPGQTGYRDGMNYYIVDEEKQKALLKKIEVILAVN